VVACEAVLEALLAGNAVPVTGGAMVVEDTEPGGSSTAAEGETGAGARIAGVGLVGSTRPGPVGREDLVGLLSREHELVLLAGDALDLGWAVEIRLLLAEGLVLLA